MCVWGGGHLRCVFRGQKSTLWSLVFPSTFMWILELELSLRASLAGALPTEPMCLVHSCYFKVNRNLRAFRPGDSTIFLPFGTFIQQQWKVSSLLGNSHNPETKRQLRLKVGEVGSSLPRGEPEVSTIPFWMCSCLSYQASPCTFSSPRF